MASLSITSIDQTNIYARVGDDKSTQVYSTTTELGLGYTSGDRLRFTGTQWGDDPAGPVVTLKNLGPRVCYLCALNSFEGFDAERINMFTRRGFEALQQYSGWPTNDADVNSITDYIVSPGFIPARGVRLNSYESATFNFNETQFVLCYQP
ncbi:hypothetical protein CCU68_10470 [Pseudomonas gingeri NCPPB 3146 = LMG 5327]|uniref:Uncharacterized protein n=2 Tax=Pseudomonas gingeri TaxID=117681 RepID=A0A7Y8CEW1_9PSED|nr:MULTISPECIES: hypothetical protein [Pseudomonas]NVZ29768.1 hypothetical protein [Pseudomonas gingeri]NVZ63492.1 hypothetical protein [Pseudomonas gingeri]NVZ78237.1 hypothetical protein [Pseudomonas gingeri]NWC16675.1 hypothetical protein [Pseudomonas gingeri]NWE47568.1 hypothetical protein [Pseudomonas gingeri]